jgi:endonuclease/exonuclease/phosphatase family metal-dependent hydrolase
MPLLLLALISCKTVDDPAVPESFSVVTYNAGLAIGFVPSANERADGTLQAIADLDADIVCVQEVWVQEHIDLLTSKTSSAFPHTYFPAASPLDDGGVGCEEDDVSGLIECADENCAETCDDDVVDCVFDNCGFDFITLEKDCQRCVMAAVGSDVAETHETCTTANPQYAYGGAFGTGILSSYEMTETDEKVFESTTNRRSVLYGKMDTPLGSTHVFCTHLSAVFATIPYPREEGGWSEEQLLEITELRAFIDDKAGSEPVILMGDFNTGPEVDGVQAEQPDNYAALAEGYDNPYEDDPALCTYCFDNPLNELGGSTSNELIDHVLVRDHGASLTADRVIDGDLQVDQCGFPIDAAPSDHYGVSVTLTVE